MNNKYYLRFLGPRIEKQLSWVVLAQHFSQTVMKIETRVQSQQRLTGWRSYFQLHSGGGWPGFSCSHRVLHRATYNTAACFPESKWYRGKESNWDGNSRKNSVFSNFRNDIPSLLPNSMQRKIKQRVTKERRKKLAQLI